LRRLVQELHLVRQLAPSWASLRYPAASEPRRGEFLARGGKRRRRAAQACQISSGNEASGHPIGYGFRAWARTQIALEAGPTPELSFQETRQLAIARERRPRADIRRTRADPPVHGPV
jgi:hypothetical protein